MDTTTRAPKGAELHGSVIKDVARGRELSSNELLPGDLIFKYSGDQLLHVSLVTSTHASGAADHAHLLNDAVLIGLHETVVSTASNLVLRCRHAQLSKTAAGYAHRWTELAMPYSNFRRRLATIHAEKVQENVVASHRKLFDQVGKYRAIKFAARRRGDLIYPSEKDPRIEGNRGMFCSMFVAVCYQVAGLENLVDPAPDGIRVSDKSTALRDLSDGGWKDIRKSTGLPQEDVDRFQTYLSCLKEVDPYVVFTGQPDKNPVEAAVMKAPKPEKPKRRLWGADYSRRWPSGVARARYPRATGLNTSRRG